MRMLGRAEMTRYGEVRMSMQGKIRLRMLRRVVGDGEILKGEIASADPIENAR